MRGLLTALNLVYLLSVGEALVETGYITCGDSLNWPRVPKDNPNPNLERESEQTVKFANTYSQPPKVLMSVYYMYQDQTQDIKYLLRLKNVTTTDFLMACATWSDTRIHIINVGWMAVDNSPPC